MVTVVGTLSLVVILGAITAGSWIMHLFFGWIGVGLFVVMSLLFGGGAFVLFSAGGRSGPTKRGSGKVSKGARRRK